MYWNGGELGRVASAERRPWNWPKLYANKQEVKRKMSRVSDKSSRLIRVLYSARPGVLRFVFLSGLLHVYQIIRGIVSVSQ